MARKIAIYSWVAAIAVTLVTILFGVAAGGEGFPGLWYAVFLGGGSFVIAIGATIAWAFAGVLDLAKPSQKKTPTWE
jgi:hypothetical protein